MRILLSLLKWAGLAIVALVLFLVLVPWIRIAGDNLTSGPYRAYLAQNQIAVDAALPDGGLQFPADFYDNRLFLHAEIHGYAAPQAFDLMMIRHLSERIDLRYYLAEMDAAEAIAANYYLDTGDDRYLRQVFERYAADKAQWGSREFFAKFQRLRAFNDTLPKEQRVRLIGVDRIDDVSWARDILRQVVGLDLLALNDIEREALNLQELADYGFEAPDFIVDPAVDVMDFNSLLALREIEAAEDASRYRHILRNMELLAERSPADEPFYGLWGQFHGMMSPVNGARPLALRLSESGVFAGKVVSLSSVYVSGSEMLTPAEALPAAIRGDSDAPYLILPASSDHPYLYYFRGIANLKSVAGEDAITIFRLNGPDSPYKEGRHLVSTSGFLTRLQALDIEGSAADAMPYVVLYQGSAPLTPWRGAAYDVQTGTERTLD